MHIFAFKYFILFLSQSVFLKKLLLKVPKLAKLFSHSCQLLKVNSVSKIIHAQLLSYAHAFTYFSSCLWEHCLHCNSNCTTFKKVHAIAYYENLCGIKKNFEMHGQTFRRTAPHIVVPDEWQWPRYKRNTRRVNLCVRTKI